MFKLSLDTTVGELIPDGVYCDGDMFNSCPFINSNHWTGFSDYCNAQVTGGLDMGKDNKGRNVTIKSHGCPKPPVGDKDNED